MSTIEQIEQAVPAGTWHADTIHSSVTFEIPYAVALFGGEVPGFDATLENGTLTGTAKIASLNVKDENLQAHLLSPEFFDAERHPELRFVSHDVRREGVRVEIPGELTLKGITQPVTLSGTVTGPAVDHFGATRVGLDLTTVIDRTQFGMNWNMPLPTGEPALANDVTLRAQLTLVQQS